MRPAFRVDRKLADLDSVRRLVPAQQETAFQPTLDLCRTQLHQAAEAEAARLRLARRPSAQPAAAESAVVQGWTGAADLTTLVPARVYPGPVSLRHHLHRLPAGEQDSWRAFAGAHPQGANLADYLCYWTDGRRTLAQVCRMTQLETGKRDDAFALGYMQLLARLGLVTGVAA